jgi:hypothetical protein
MAEGTMPMEVFAKARSDQRRRACREPRSSWRRQAIMACRHALLHNIKHNKVLHERGDPADRRRSQDVPFVPPRSKRWPAARHLGQGFYRVMLRYGFLEETDVPAALKPRLEIELRRRPFEMMRDQLLPVAPDADRFGKARHGRSGAKSCSPGCCAMRPSAMEFSACRPTAWSNWAVRSKSSPYRSFTLKQVASF